MTLCIEQAGKNKQGRPSGLNKLGRGQAENWTPPIIDPERAPAELPYRIL